MIWRGFTFRAAATVNLVFSTAMLLSLAIFLIGAKQFFDTRTPADISVFAITVAFACVLIVQAAASLAVLFDNLYGVFVLRVVAAIELLAFPLGTAIGMYTIYTLHVASNNPNAKGSPST